MAASGGAGLSNSWMIWRVAAKCEASYSADLLITPSYVAAAQTISRQRLIWRLTKVLNAGIKIRRAGSLRCGALGILEWRLLETAMGCGLRNQYSH